MFDPSLTWKDIAWFKSITSLPILVKGVLTAEDARQAVEHGVSGIIVSNHGGRQLDSAPATVTNCLNQIEPPTRTLSQIEALPEVVEAIAGRIPVFVDGGVRSGTDVFKAIALGARGVFVGRPVLWGLAHAVTIA